MSVSGSDPDADGDGDPTNDQGGTGVTIGFSPEIGISKRVVSGPTIREDGCFDLTYEFRVKNYGDLAVGDIQIVDDLANTFVLADSFYIIGLSSEEFSVNTGFNGATDTNLLNGNDTLMCR